MSSLGSILSIASSALRANQAAVSVTAHNLANAETEGFSRQRAVVTSGHPTYLPQGAYGSGVQVQDVERVRDEYTNTTVRRESSLARQFSTRSEALGRVESLLSEPGGQGLVSGLDAFFSGWSELSAHPTSDTARTVLRSRGEELADRFQRMASGLEQLRRDVGEQLEGDVRRINDIAQGVANLNRDIVTAESGGKTAGDLRDSRDRLLDELAGLTPITVSQREDGSVGVMVSGLSLVDGVGHGRMEAAVDAGRIGLRLVGQTRLLPDSGGSTGARIDVLNEDLRDARQALDDLASALVADVNAIHRTGTNRAGETDVDFFDPTAVTATSIRLSAAVQAGSGAISAGTADALGAPRPGANDVALLLGGLRDRPLTATGETAGGSVRRLVSRVGVSLRSSLDRESVHRTLADQSEVQRSSVSGVSTDEEMSQLIRFQAAYAAAARVVSVADEMMDTLLRI